MKIILTTLLLLLSVNIYAAGYKQPVELGEPTELESTDNLKIFKREHHKVIAFDEDIFNTSLKEILNYYSSKYQRRFSKYDDCYIIINKGITITIYPITDTHIRIRGERNEPTLLMKMLIVVMIKDLIK